MLGYDVVKWIHIVSAVVLFATGLGTALRMWLVHRRGNAQAIAATARNAVRIDWTLTATSGLLVPVTGAILVGVARLSPVAPWLVASYLLYAVAAGCWVAAARLRIRVRDLAAAAAGSGEPLPERYLRYMRWWFQLSWPAFVAFLVVFYLMLARPEADAIRASAAPTL